MTFLETAHARGGPLPVDAVVPSVRAALQGQGAAVLVSPPGTGKTTLVPLALADATNGRVVVAEPRRVAARAAARRMAWLLGEPVGETVGYTVRGDRAVGRNTRIEVVTTGVLVQRLQRDAELPGTAAIMLDECHERHLDTDLALAFTVESRAALRPDLMLLAASATADAERLAAVLGGTVIGADAPLHEVRTVWAPPSSSIDPPRGLRVDPRLLDHVAAIVRRALAETDGDLLVFLPGAGEINGVARRLGGVNTVPLHGRLSSREQDAALTAGAHRRVVLATDIAETSLTVPGVRTVVDAGLARVPRLDLARGLGSLVTTRVSRSAAHQRAGRAGREAPGQVYRCWSAADHTRLPAHPEPEIATADLTAFALALARWGDPDATGLPLLDHPPEAAATVARQTLLALGAVAEDGRITDRGRRLAAVGVHPRLARALLDGAPLVGDRRAAELVAVLADDPQAGTDDLAAVHRQTRDRLRDETRRLLSAADLSRPATAPGSPATAPGSPGDARGLAGGGRRGQAGVADDLAAGIIAGLAFPERLARRRGGSYLMASGTGGELAPGSPLTSSPWLAVAVAQRQPGAAAARIRLAAAIDEATALEVGAGLRRVDDEVGWAGGDVVARRVERLGAIELSEKPLRDVPRERRREALRVGLAKEGLSLLTWSDGARALRARLALLHQALPGWPDAGDAALLEHLDVWLGPDLVNARRRADLARIDVAGALRRLLDHRQAARLAELAPERLAVPSGSQVKVTYDDDATDPGAPVLAVKLQETFGWTATPRIAEGRVPVVLHLLSPGGRALAVTSDLASFWANAYPAVRGEMRGRYPKHPWPDDPLAAAPTARTNRRR